MLYSFSGSQNQLRLRVSGIVLLTIKSASTFRGAISVECPKELCRSILSKVALSVEVPDERRVADSRNMSASELRSN